MSHDARIHRIKAKVTTDQKKVIGRLQTAIAQQDRSLGNWVGNVSEQDLLIRGLVLLCRKYKMQWPEEVPPRQDRSAQDPAPEGPVAEDPQVEGPGSQDPPAEDPKDPGSPAQAAFPAPGSAEWDSQPLGRVADRDLARDLDLPVRDVTEARRLRNIASYDSSPRKFSRAPAAADLADPEPSSEEELLGPAPRSSRYVDWSQQPLGKKPDAQVAEDLGVDVQLVSYVRGTRGIPPYRGRFGR